jgi:malate dehydrogenase (oxaloacetate-decarboxylating)(NADP+)
MMISGTAIISSAALLNALELAGKKLNIQNSGFRSGSAALACANLYVLLGINPDNIIVRKDGVISSERNDLSAKKIFKRKTRNYLRRCSKGADVFLVYQLEIF